MQEKPHHIEQELLAACCNGEEKALYELYHICYSDLYAVCKRYLNDQDEIGLLLNSGFLKIVNGLNGYKKHIPFEAWIKRIMINTVIDHHRKQKKYRETITYPELIVEPNHRGRIDFNAADQLFDAEQLMHLIGQLPPMTARVFNLYAIDGYRHKEIAGLLDITDGTSKWHLSTARKKLQAMITELMNSKKNESKIKYKLKKA